MEIRAGIFSRIFSYDYNRFEITCKIFKWDPGLGTPKVGLGTLDHKIFEWNPRLPVFYSFNRLFYT